jgi:predicted protein tyrosine phosphatase
VPLAEALRPILEHSAPNSRVLGLLKRDMARFKSAE